MKAQDKEFDDLFRSKLEDLEMEPSANVWAGIDAELNAGQRKNKLLPWLSIAAGIIVLVTAGILFIPKKSRVDPAKPGRNNLAHNTVVPAVVKPGVMAAVNAPGIKAIKPESIIRANNVVVVHQPKKIIIAKPAVQTAPVNNGPVTAKPDEQPVLATVAQKPADIIDHVVPDNTSLLAAGQTVITGAPDAAPQPVLARAQPADNEQTVKKHRVRNFGDLFNIVIAKVDKRKDKFIVFSDSDDDESTVSAVNIGPIKIGPTQPSPEGRALK